MSRSVETIETGQLARDLDVLCEFIAAKQNEIEERPESERFAPDGKDLGEHYDTMRSIVEAAIRITLSWGTGAETVAISVGSYRSALYDQAQPSEKPASVEFGPDDLRRRRKDLGLSLAQLGQQLGISRGTIWRWEDGRIGIEHPQLLHLALTALEGS